MTKNTKPRNSLIIVNKIIKRTNKNWIYGIENAQVVIKYAWCFKSINEMLSNEFLIFFGDLNTNNYFTNAEYIKKLKFGDWSYSDFVISAILYVLQHELQKPNPSLFVFTQNIARVVLDTTELGEFVFELLYQTDIFYNFPLHCITGFQFFNEEFININSQQQPNYFAWLRFLKLFDFYFPISFQNKCAKDCEKYQSLAPLMLALYAYEYRLSDLSVNADFDRFIRINNFYSFKKKLIEKKLVNKNYFLMLCFERKKLNIFMAQTLKFN